jgi:hypothetical protein
MKIIKEKITTEVTDAKTGTVTRQHTEKTTFHFAEIGILLSLLVAVMKVMFFG